jgi:hypothetical protein
MWYETEVVKEKVPQGSPAASPDVPVWFHDDIICTLVRSAVVLNTSSGG